MITNNAPKTFPQITIRLQRALTIENSIEYFISIFTTISTDNMAHKFHYIIWQIIMYITTELNIKTLYHTVLISNK